jgi:LPXTG-motif cell wall-anchored protein
MTKVSIVVLLLTASTAFAGSVTVPEIDPGVGISALALLSGGLLLLRSRRKS